MDRVQALADRLLAARRTGRPVVLATGDDGPGNYDEVYRIQEIVAQAVGDVGAFKVGRKSRDDAPVYAPIFASTIRKSPAHYRANELRLVGIELEIAFRIIRPLPDPAGPDFIRKARGSLAALPLIEMVDTRLADHEAAGAFWKLADNQINAGLVVGAELTDWSHLNTTTPKVHFAAGGTIIAEGQRAVPGGDAYENFCALAQALGEHCGGLRPGHIVTTGSLTGLVFIEHGVTVRGSIDGLGAVEVRID